MTDSSKGRKERILFNWNYHRRDHTSYLKQVAETFEIVFLHDYEKGNEPSLEFPCSFIYWNEYVSPYQLLNKVRPHRIVFYDIESYHQVALNMAARNRRIVTFVLEHGLRGDYEVDIDIKKYYEAVAGRDVLIPVQNLKVSRWQKVKTFRFYLSAFRLKNSSQLHHFILFLFYRRRYGLTVGLYKLRYPFRWAEFYISITQLISSYIRKRDGVPESRFIYIGNAGFDDFFNKMTKAVAKPAQPYLLLLDAPFVEGDIFFMKTQEKNLFISRLNEFARKNNLLLRIKLHPISYKSDYFIKADNIYYHCHDDLTELIMNAEVCAHVHLSTLVPLAMLYKPFLFFNAYSEFNVFITERGIAYYDYFNFNPDELKISSLDEMQKKKLIEDFLYSTDGRSVRRLVEALKSKAEF